VPELLLFTMGEIDDIFSGGKKAAAPKTVETLVAEKVKRTAAKSDKLMPTAELQPANPSKISKKKKKQNKQKNEVASAPASTAAVDRKWAVASLDDEMEVETFDYSAAPAAPKLHRPPDDDGFGDSRGRRKTDDGMDIYTDKELRIGEGEGDTPDCPFDCWCCF
jgi:Eukaryotic protein of unknown function (DUF1764)